jgi:hypothetical protein
MLTNTHRWSHTRGNTVVPYRWQATGLSERSRERAPHFSDGSRMKIDSVSPSEESCDSGLDGGQHVRDQRPSQLIFPGTPQP